MSDKPSKPKSKKRKGTKASGTKLKAHVTHLEMTHRLQKVFPQPRKPVTALMIARNIPPAFYRYIYKLVGRPHHWEDRRTVGDSELSTIINGDDCQIGILYADGCPAGFYELDLGQLPESVQIRYFGLGTAYQGLGLGRWFLGLTVQAAWAHQPEKVTVETNTLDHPAGLRLYQMMGFSPVAVSDVEIEPWD